MFDFRSSVFNGINIPNSAKIIFVSDMFVEDYVGGAELTSQALIDSSPFEVFKLHSRDVSVELLEKGHDRFWIFGNFSELNPQLIPTIIGNMRYSNVEYDYKYCKMRSPEKHMEMAGVPCDCAGDISGKMVSAFYYGSMGIWWMAEKQKERYLSQFPFLAERDNIVLSSVFSDSTLGLLKHLRAENASVDKKGWLVLGSPSWIKGADDAERWCKDNAKQYEIVWNESYIPLLRKLAIAEGFVYLPKGGDTCPRMVIEAKLLGCKLHMNDNVQHKDEEWFAADDLESIEGYLYSNKMLFWNGIKRMMDYRPTISGYTTVYNAVKQQYPFEQCIKSMLEFCDEVCVVDGGSTDGTLQRLEELQKQHLQISREGYEEAKNKPSLNFVSNLKVKIIPRDWSSKRHPVFDGAQKAAARAMCTKEFCWQMDADEVVHEDDAKKIPDMCRAIPKNVDILSLPVIEFWGGPEKVRCGIQPWKWRLSRNLPYITHGIPVDLRRTDSDGSAFAAMGTDGCDMIDKTSGERLPHMSFYAPDVENVRQIAMIGNEQARAEYEKWFNSVVNELPCVFHYSWYDLKRKITLYRDYWQNHWRLLWDQDASDAPENNMFFDVPWAEVSDEMIETRASELNKIGGWVFHTKWRGEVTPWISCNRTQPKVMQ